MASRAESIIGFAVVKEDGGLAFADGQLGAPFDLAGTGLGDAMDQFLSRFVKPFNNLKKNDPTRAQRSQHVSGRELLEGLRAHALDQFGPLAKTVLESWGVRRCTDFGDIVFNLIEYNIFSKTDNDRREDFADIYDFDEAFVKPFQPAGKRRAGPSTETVSSV